MTEMDLPNNKPTIFAFDKNNNNRHNSNKRKTNQSIIFLLVVFGTLISSTQSHWIALHSRRAISSSLALVFKQPTRQLKTSDDKIINNNMSKEESTEISKTKILKTEERDAKWWNKEAQKYSQKPIEDMESYGKKLNWTRDYLTPESKVLEFGCGTGGTAIHHAPRVQILDATDISSEMISIAEAKAKEAGITNINFEVIGIDRLERPSESYHVILGLSILHLLPNRDDVIRKVYSWLKPNGVFISSSVCIGDFAGILRYVAPVATYLNVFPKINVFTADDLRTALKDVGFEIEKEFQPGKSKGLFIVARKKATVKET